MPQLTWVLYIITHINILTYIANGYNPCFSTQKNEAVSEETAPRTYCII